jgi:hypothetical protein
MEVRKLTAAFFILLFTAQHARSCSSYKVTAGGKTMVGSNYDTWLQTPRIWFETNGYGSAFTGSRADGSNGFAPQTGMNEYGLAFITLATATPRNGTAPAGKKQIAGRTNYLKDILHSCKTTGDVYAYIDQYDHSTLSEDVFLYIDSTGKYLVVEPYAMTPGYDSKYVLANFCPSTITDFSTVKQQRYINGTAFLKNKIDSSVSFCASLSDTMHVCRKKIGDGTLLTSIWDLNDGITYLYFYHDYHHQVAFRLKDELAKGNHSVEIPPLFPANEEFQKLVAFKTPMNTPAMDMFLRFCAGLFFVSSVYFPFSYFRKSKTTGQRYVKLLLIPFSLILLFYMFMLARVENVFYFPAPYSDGSLSVVSIASYAPFLVALFTILLLFWIRKIFIESNWSFISKGFLTLNMITWMVLVVLFSYWGFYNIFS